MTAGRPVAEGRESFRERAWADACRQLAAADLEAPLAVEDLERLATATYLVGRDDDSIGMWARAHQECLRLGDAARAARCAFWLALGLLLKGDLAQGSGWLGRARRVLGDDQPDCAEQGYLLVPVAIHTLAEGDSATAYGIFGQVVEIGERFRDLDLVTMAQLGRGQALIRLGKPAEGVALFDEVMVAVSADEVSPIVAGIVYCAVIEECLGIFDVRRAREWTAALNQWCSAQPDLAAFRGQCLVHRAEIMQLHGAWPDALDEAKQACARLSEPAVQPAVGAALYQLGELHRLRGEYVAAEEAYQKANQRGRKPQPGLALLRLARGQIQAAAAAIGNAVDETTDPAARAKVLAAYVEIVLAAGDVHSARVAVDELVAISAELEAPYLRAIATHANGAVLLAEGHGRAALTALRGAWTAWQDLEVPYEAARARVLLGLACRQVGDEDTAYMELDAARWIFHELGAAPDLARVDALTRPASSTSVGGLTSREAQVLRQIAAGKSNRAIATDLFLSEKTVARHVSNILRKLGLPSRSAATAYAYEHDLL